MRYGTVVFGNVRFGTPWLDKGFTVWTGGVWSGSVQFGRVRLGMVRRGVGIVVNCGTVRYGRERCG